jgi:hypothetical protein
MYLAYYYSIGKVSTAFQALHQRMQDKWSNKFELDDEKVINEERTPMVIDTNDKI